MATNRRGRATRDQILDVTDALMVERGLDLTIEEVALAAGVSRPTVYRHFGDRGALITSAALRLSAALGRRLAAVLDTDRPFRERLSDAIVAVAREARENAGLRSVLAAGNPAVAWPDVDQGGRFVDASREFFRPWLVAAVDSGEVELRADVETTLDWLLRQILLLMTVPSALGEGDDAVRRDVETFVLPGILAT